MPTINKIRDTATGIEYDVGAIVETTWATLKTLRDNSGLVPGQWYRITDYTCTTTTANTTSAGHVFDIIVRADAANVLNENACAALHSGDTYFANSDLGAWELKYSLDNNTDKFAWADSTNGKGIIYWMKDEFGNECPYDFKNILFTKSGKYTNAYTFTYTNSSVLYDASLEGLAKKCYSNVIKEYLDRDSNKLTLNFNVFYSTSADADCYGNIFGTDCYDNFFGEGGHSNAFGYNCYSNAFGNYCRSNTFGNGCYSNTFGNRGYFNTFGDECFSNTFGNSCNSNTISDYCSSNTFGNFCHSNTFGYSCRSNTFGNYCIANTFNYNCCYNTFGNNCLSNTFGNTCYSITFGNSSSAINYCTYNIFDNGCKYIYLSSTDTDASSSNYLQNVHIHLGVTGSSQYNRLSIVIPDRNLAYETNYVKTGTNTVEL